MDKNRLAIDLFDHHSEGYLEKYFNVDLYQESLQFFISALPADPSILDLGCGPGNVARYVLDRIPKSIYLATDLSQKMVEIAKIKVPDATVEILDCRRADETHKKFNGIICSFCIPYLNDPEVQTFVQKLPNSLDDSGLIYLSFIGGLIKKAEEVTASSGMKMMMNYYPKETITGLLKTNFDILYSQELISYNKKDADIIIIGKKKA